MNDKSLEDDNVVLLKLHVAVSDSEEARLSRLLEERIEKYGQIRVLLLLEGYPAADNAESLYEDMGFLKLHGDHIERLAVVGDRIWQETWIALFGLFGGMETAYFDGSEKKEAVKWIGRQSL